MKMQSRRAQKLAQLIKRVISELISQEIKDPRIGFITITRVKLSNDLKSSNIYYTLLGDNESKESTRKGLTRAKGYLRSHLGARLRLRRVPEIEFVFDKFVEESIHLNELLKEVRQEEAGNS